MPWVLSESFFVRGSISSQGLVLYPLKISRNLCFSVFRSYIKRPVDEIGRAPFDNQTDIVLKLLFCFWVELCDFPWNLFRIFSVKNILSHVTPGSCDVIIWFTLLECYFSKILTSTKFWALRSSSFLFFEIYNHLPF